MGVLPREWGQGSGWETALRSAKTGRRLAAFHPRCLAQAAASPSPLPRPARCLAQPEEDEDEDVSTADVPPSDARRLSSTAAAFSSTD
jgi:hypothetical protein